MRTKLKARASKQRGNHRDAVIKDVYAHDPDSAVQYKPSFVLKPINIPSRMHNIRLQQDLMTEIKAAFEDGNDVSVCLLH